MACKSRSRLSSRRFSPGLCSRAFFNLENIMKAPLYFLIFLCFLVLCEHLIYIGHAGWAYAGILGAIGTGILMFDAIVERRLKKAMADRVLK